MFPIKIIHEEKIPYPIITNCYNILGSLWKSLGNGRVGKIKIRVKCAWVTEISEQLHFYFKCDFARPRVQI